MLQIASFDVGGLPPGTAITTDGEHGIVAVFPDNYRARKLWVGCYAHLLHHKSHVDDLPRPAPINTFEVVSAPRQLMGPAAQTIEQNYGITPANGSC